MNIFFTKGLIFSSFVCFLLLIGAVNIYQPSIIKSDGSGSFKLSYFTSDSNIAKTTVMGNYGFTEGEAQTNFTSENTEVKSVKIFNDKDKGMTHMVLEIDFKDINKISEAKGFSDIRASWVETDSGMVFQWVILKNLAQLNLIGELIYIFTFDGANTIISPNGAIKDNTATWALNTKNTDFTKDVILTATVKSDKKNKSCGSAGIELPIVILFGLMISYSFRKSKIQ